MSAGYAASTSSPANVETSESTVTVNWGYSPTLAIRPGTTETFTGTAYVNDNGVHLPVPGAIVTLYDGTKPTSVRTTTAANGYVANVTGVVKFYNRAKGTTTWRYLGSARVGGNGDVAFSVKGAPSGSYQAVFAAQGYFLASSATATS